MYGRLFIKTYIFMCLKVIIKDHGSLSNISEKEEKHLQMY